MFTTQQAVDSALRADLARANMVEPRPSEELEPFHFSDEFRDVALRHIWTRNQAQRALEIRERGMPRWI